MNAKALVQAFEAAEREITNDYTHFPDDLLVRQARLFAEKVPGWRVAIFTTAWEQPFADDNVIIHFVGPNFEEIWLHEHTSDDSWFSPMEIRAENGFAQHEAEEVQSADTVDQRK